jgi:ectoine hydroxylase-related dioxygenase (phytanoyl-CoA dioxygenase family)
MLFLTDAARGEGSFECVPSIFQDLDRYLDEHPGRVLDAPVDVAGHDVVEVPARAGDLVVWDARLPHQGGRNRGGRPRISLAVSMHQRARTPTVRNASNAGIETRSSVVAWLEGTDRPRAR